MQGKRVFLIGALALAAGAAAITYMKYAPRRTPRGQPPLVNLSEDDLRPFERAFNDEGASRKRVVVMLSPT